MKRSAHVLVYLVLMLAIATPYRIASAEEATPPAGYTNYTVVAGDSLAKIADKTGSSIEKLKEVNPSLKSDILRIGQILLAPGYVAPSTTAYVRPAGLPAGSIAINGTGATFPAPIYASWTYTYLTVDPVAAVNYQPTGSGAGKKAIIDRTVDFGGSDSLLSAKEYTSGGDLQMYPMVAGAVVPAFNLTDEKGKAITKLTLSRDTLAKIFLGKITNWNDAALVALNPKVTLPNKPITTVHRSDGSGTTEIFTKALSSFSDEWKTKVGGASTVQWPNGLGGPGNAGVAAAVKNTPSSIGYVELSFAIENKIPFSLMVNKAGITVQASAKTLQSAMSDFAGKFDSKLTVTLVDAPGRLSWPIAGYTYVIVHTNSMTDCNKAATMLGYFKWSLTSAAAASAATNLGYAVLPGEVRSQTLAKLAEVTCNGLRVLP